MVPVPERSGICGRTHRPCSPTAAQPRAPGKRRSTKNRQGEFQVRIMLPVPARFLVATLCCLSLHAVAQADAARPQASPAAQQAACDKGDNRACSLLAYRYEDGNGVAKDAARAIALKERACDLGNEAECFSLGYGYEKGKFGLPEDRARSAKFHLKACELGDKESCCNVYRSCARFEGECQDPTKRDALYLRAARANDPEKDYLDCWIGGEAEYLLAIEAGKSQPAPAAPTAARQTPQAAEPSVAALQGDCDRGSAKACFSLAEKYGTGKGVPKDEATSARLHEQACRGKFLLGCSVLGSLYLSGQGVPASIEQASAIWQYACDAGEPGSCTLLGVLYELRRKPADPATAAVYYQKGCNGGHGDGCTQLSKLYRSGLGVPQDAARADELWQLGCKRGSAACKQGQPSAGSSTELAVQSTAPPPAQSTGRPSQEVCRRMLLDEIGVVGVDAARTAIHARFQEVITGNVPNTQNLRLEARSSACGDDPRGNPVLYDFDAGGVLRAITIVWARPSGPAPAPIFSERARLLAMWYPQGLRQSAVRLEGKSDVRRVVLQDMPGQGVLLEAYTE